MNILELKEQEMNLRSELETIVANGEKEQRELNEEETSKIAELRAQIDGLKEQISQAEKENEKVLRNNNIKKENNKMSLIKMINDVVEGRSFDEATQAEVNAAKEEMRKSGLSTKGQIVLRAINATTKTEGQENVPEQKMSIELALRDKLVATKIGATVLGGLVGDVSIPTYSGSQVAWKGETAQAANGEGEFDEVVLQPKRLTGYIDVSKQFLLQDSNDAEAMLISDIAAAIAEKFDQTIFGSASGDTNTPAGLFANVEASGAVADIEYNDVLALEEGIEEKNGSDFVFVASPKVKYALKGTQMASGLQMVYAGNEIDGYPAHVSNAVVSKGIMAIDPKSLVVGQWGGIDIVVDPYTQAANGCVRIVVNAYMDGKMKSDRLVAKIFE